MRKFYSALLTGILGFTGKRLIILFALLFTTFFIQQGFGQVLAWDYNGRTGGEATVTSTTTNANLSISTISRGAGLSIPAAGLNRFPNTFDAIGYRASGSTLATAVTDNAYFQFTISVNAGFIASLSTLDATFLRSSANAPTTFQWEYSLNAFATAGVNIGAAITYNGTNTTGTAQTQINLSGIAALQNIASGTNITIRIYGWGAGNVGSTFALGASTGTTVGNDLSIGGTVVAAPPTITSLGSASGCQGTSITINGTNLTGTTAPNVKIGGTAVTSIISNSGTQIVAVIGGGTTGIVTVITAGGTATSAATFTVNPLPATITVSGGGTFCGSTTITAANGSDGTMYFQGTTSNGTSTATPSNSQLITTSGTYYFRAQSAAGCWSIEGSTVVTINAIPTTVTVVGGGIFCGSTTITATGGTGGTIYFQGTTSGGTSTVTASSSAVVSTSGTYYFRANNSCGWGTEGSVIVTINPIPATVTVSGGGTFCGSTTITAANGSDGTMYFQGTTSNGTSTATPSNSQLITTSGTYYFRAQSAAGCWSIQGSTVVTINAIPTAVTVSGGGTFCGSTTITATGGTGGTIYFQGTTSGGTSTTTASSSQSVSASGTYYFRARSAAGCWGTEGSVIVTINPLPATVTVTGGGTFCGSTTITAANGSDGTMYFQGTTSNGTSTATPSNSQLITTSGTYYFRAQSAAGCWSTQGSTVVTINTVPTTVTVTGGGTFCGSTTITAAGGTGGTIYFQGTTSGGTSTATASSSQSVSASGTYYFRARSAAGCWGTEGSVIVTINPLPATVTVTGGGTFCGSTTITAANGSDGTMYFQGTTSNGTSTATPSNSQLITTSGTYYFRAQSAAGCWSIQGSTVVTINAIPTAVTVSGGGTFCGSTTITATGGTGGTIYFQGTTSGGTSTATASSSQSVSASGTYYFRARSAAGCWGTEGSVIVTINPLPATVTVSGGGTFCGSTTITAANGSDGTMYFQGTASNGTSTATPSNSQLITTSGTYYFRAQSAAGCWSIQGSTVVTIDPLPTGTLTATETSGTTNNDNTICTGATVTFTFSNSTYGSYIFKVGGVIKQTGTSNTYSSSTLPTGASSVTVDVANSFNCGATFGPIIITVSSLPIPTLVVTENSGTPNNNTICPNTSVTLTAPANAGSTYSFIIGGSTVSTGSSNTYTLSTIAANTTVAIMETNSNGCQATTAPQNITVSPVPSGTLTVSPGTSFCAGTSVTFTANAGAGNTYNFKVGSTSIIQSNLLNTFTTTALANGDVVTVVVTNSSGCSATLNAIAVTVNQPPSGTLNAFENSGTQNDNSICANAPVTFTFSNTTYAGYNFKVNGVSKQNNGTASYTNNTLVAGDAVTIIVTSGSGCTATFTAPTISIVASPVITLSASPTTICTGDNVTFTATPLDPTYNYNFQVNGATVQNGLGNNTYSSTSISSTDVVTVDVTNSNSCTTTSNPVSVTVNPLPTGTLIPVENSGNAPANDGIICAGATVVFTAPTGFSNYDFILNGATVQSGSGRTYTNNTLADNDNVTVAVTNAGGCIGLLNTVSITVNTLPAVAPITGTLSVCINSTTPLLDATSGGIWSTSNASIATVDAAGVVTGIAAGTVTINYTFSNTNSCSNTASATVTVNALPIVAVITGNVNVCTVTSSQFSNTTTGGIWSSSNSAIATVNSSGLVDGISPGTATISYAVTNGNSCTTTVTIGITVSTLPVVAAITGTTNVCVSGTTALSDATTGGIWSSNNTLIATVNASGVVSGVAGGTTTIDYTITTSCSQTVTASATITVTAAPSATIAYTGGTFCTTSGTVPVSQTGTTGGTYSSAAGLTINSGNGTITPATSTGGLYIVTYTVAAAGGCGIYTTTAPVTITTAPSATISYSGSPFCTSTSPVTVTRTGTAGGTYSSTSGLTINSATGTITPATSTNGTYTVTYTILASGGCAQFSTNTSVIITSAPSATIAYAGGPFCTSVAPVNVTLTGTPGGTYSSTAGLTIVAGTGTITPATSTNGTYIVTYAISASGGCAAFTTTTSVTINAAPTAVAGANVLTCSNSGAVDITTGSSAINQASVLWTSSGTGTFTNANSLTTATYAPSAADIAAGSRILTLTANGNGSCAAATSTKTITINALPATPTITPTPAAICNGGSSNLVVTVPGSGPTTIVNYNFNSGGSYAALTPALASNITSTVSGSATFGTATGIASGSNAFTANAVGNALSSVPNKTWIFTVGGTDLPTYKTFKVYYQADRNPGGANTVTLAYSLNGGSFSTTGITNSVGANPINLTNSATWYEVLLTLPVTADNPTTSLAFQLTIANSGTGNVQLDNFEVQAIGLVYKYSWTATPSATAGLPGTAGTSLATNNNISVSPSVTTDYFVTVTNTNGCSNNPTKVTVTVNPTPVVTITADYCAVAGKVRLTASSIPAGATYSWNTIPAQTGAVIDVDIADDYTVTATVGSCTGTATISVAQELVVNGDFSAGNTGFFTEYGYTADIAGNTELYPEGLYAVGTSGQNYHDQFYGKEHTTPAQTGNFMLVNGSTTLIGSPARQRTIWQETVSVLPNTNYYFSAYGMNLNPASPAQLRFEVNGVQVGTIADLNVAPKPTSNGAVNINNWVRFYSNPTWTSGPTTTTAVIRIINLNNTPGGNDFGLDDISFGTLSTFINLESAPGTDAQTPCINTAITPIVYSVGSNASAPTIVPALPAGLVSFFNGVTLTISGTPTVAVNYSYTITTTGSCQPSTATGTINVQAQAITLSSGSASPSVCVNSSVNIGFTLSGTATGATVTGPSFLTGSVLGTAYTISGIPTVAGSYPYTISTTGNCAPVTFNGTITVTSQTITLNSGSNTQTVCITSPIANIQYAVGGTGNNATVSGLPPGVAGTYNSGLFIISGSPTSAAGSPYSYTVTTAGTSCAAVTASGTITVTPGGSLSLTSAPATNPQTVCKGTAIVDITYAVTNATGASASGLPTGVNGGFSGGVFTISGTPTATAGTFNYTVTTSGGCVPASATGVITIQSQSIVLTSGTASPSVCMNTAMTNIVYTIGGTATGATVTGLPASGVIYSISGNVITISGTPNLSGALPYLITTSGTCTPVTANGTITVQPAAIGGTLNSVSICSGGSGSLTLSGQSGSITRWEFSTNGGTSWTPTPILNTTITQSFSNITVPTLYRVLVTNGCSPVFSSIATVGLHNLWVGGTSSDWNTASNWSDNLVPSMSCPAVTIPAVVSPNLYPVLSIGAIATINNLVINSGASLIITNNTMQIAGTITNNGTFDVSNGSVELNGTSAQTIPANVFATNKIKDLIISNNVSIAAASGQDSLTGMLTFSGSNKTFNTNDKLTLKSTAANTAAVGQIINGNSISGNVTVERYISAKRAWRFLSVPTNTTQTFHQGWQENQAPLVVGTIGYGTQVTNIVNPTPANGFDYYSAAGPSVKKYDITATGPYAPYRSINATSDLMATTEGIMTFVRGDRTAVGLYATPTITVLRTQGPLKTQNQTYTVSPGAFKSIGNPYAAPLDMRQVDVLGTKEFFYIWDPNLTGPLGLGAFQTFALVGGNYYPTPGGGSYPSQSPSAAPYNYIQSGSAFFVAGDPNATSNKTVTITESSKASSATAGNVLVFRPASANQTTARINTNLYAIEPDASLNLVDGTLNQFADMYSNAIDRFDAVKITNFAENLAIKTDGQLLVVERKQSILRDDTIHLNMLKMKVKSYRFEFVGQNFAPGLTGFLEDSYYNTRIPLDINATSTYDFNVINVPGSWNPDRFRIVFATAAGNVLPVTFTSVKAYPKDNDIAVDWKVEDERNIKAYEVERSADGQHFSRTGTVEATGNNGSSVSYQWPDIHPLAGSNYYRIKSIGISGEVIYSNIVKVVTGSSKAQLMVYPNPVSDGNINLQLINQPKGSYGIRLMNKLGQVIMVKQIDHLDGSSTEHLSVKLLAHGAYNLEVTLPDNTQTNINVLY